MSGVKVQDVDHILHTQAKHPEQLSLTTTMKNHAPKTKDFSFLSHFKYEHLLAGISGGAISTLILHPLDLMKIRFAVSDGRTAIPQYGSLTNAFYAVVRQEGIRGLYRGVAPNVWGSGSAWGFYFLFYNSIKNWIQQGDSQYPLGPSLHMLAAAEAGILTLLVTNPIWVVKTRLCLQYGNEDMYLSKGGQFYNGVSDALVKIYRTEGVRGLYRGFVPGMFGVIHGALQFMTYEEMKAFYNKYQKLPTNSKLTTGEYLGFAAISKLIAAAATYPYQVLYEEKEEDIELLEQHTSPIVRSATCILQTETDPYELLENLPKNIESLTLIQGYESGNKSVKFSYLNAFLQLIILELVGPNIKHNSIESHLICEIDTPISDLRYLNLERVLIKNSKQQMINVLKKITQEELTFEYIQKVSSTLHSLTMLQRGGIDEDILPYEVFKQQQDTNRDVPLFVGFKKLFLLRITDCDLNGIHWEMFDGLNTLRYLILDRNNIKFIPPFTFYGTPNLKDLSLAHNKLLDIQITDLAGLLELEYLDLSYNNFTQLSELSLPPFPKLKLANFANNPIGVIFPSTFEVMNTTNSLIIGSDYMPLTLITNSLLGLSLLEKLTINNLKLKLLKRDMFFGMPHLKELVITGNITDIEYDAFLEINRIEKLQLSRCQVQNISMDAFIGLVKLQYLDLSENSLEFLPPGVFDHLTNIKEIYLNANKFQTLPRDIFSRIHPKLIRLNDNPWECSCEMSEWKPMIVNKIKQKISKPCNFASNKGPSCATGQNWQFKYLYENKVAPKCAKPQEFINWNIFHAMRRILKCPGYKPKLRKHINFKHLDNTVKEETTENLLTTGSPKLEFNVTVKNAAQPYTSLEDLHFNNNNLLSKTDKLHVKYRKSYLKKYPKKISHINNSIFNS